jgi:hypothetical protein
MVVRTLVGIIMIIPLMLSLAGMTMAVWNDLTSLGSAHAMVIVIYLGAQNLVVLALMIWLICFSKTKDGSIQ